MHLRPRNTIIYFLFEGANLEQLLAVSNVLGKVRVKTDASELRFVREGALERVRECYNNYAID